MQKLAHFLSVSPAITGNFGCCQFLTPMRTFLLRSMQAMMLFSICFLAYWTSQFFTQFIYEPFLQTQQQDFVCGTVPELGSYNPMNGPDGKLLFNANCASCHKIDQKLTGPALQGVEDRWPDKKKLYAWIRDSDSILQSGDKYAKRLFKEFDGIKMNKFPGLADDEIEAILRYVNHQH